MKQGSGRVLDVNPWTVTVEMDFMWAVEFSREDIVRIIPC